MSRGTLFAGKRTIDVISQRVLQARTNEEAVLKISDVELLALAADAKLVVSKQLI